MKSRHIETARDLVHRVVVNEAVHRHAADERASNRGSTNEGRHSNISVDKGPMGAQRAGDSNHSLQRAQRRLQLDVLGERTSDDF
jgi:hypothetical protein